MGRLRRRTPENEYARDRAAKPNAIGLRGAAERCKAQRHESPAGQGHQIRWQSNVKHQRARAEVSRVKDELPVRALRCMRKFGDHCPRRKAGRFK